MTLGRDPLHWDSIRASKKEEENFKTNLAEEYKGQRAGTTVKKERFILLKRKGKNKNIMQNSGSRLRGGTPGKPLSIQSEVGNTFSWSARETVSPIRLGLREKAGRAKVFFGGGSISQGSGRSH